MNQAYADGSQAGEVGGWGVVLMVPGQPDQHLCGQVPVRDNGACELIAVLEAVRRAPAGQPLTVHTDATSVMQSVRRGSGHPDQNELGAQVRREAHARGIRLQLSLGPRDGRRMQEAHLLAAGARIGQPPMPPERPQVRVKVRPLRWGAEATMTFRRGGESRTARVPLPEREGVPPAVQALAAVVDLARDGEHLHVRVDSALAAALWEEPKRSLYPEALQVLIQARAEAERRHLTLDFG